MWQSLWQQAGQANVESIGQANARNARAPRPGNSVFLIMSLPFDSLFLLSLQEVIMILQVE